LESGEAKTRKEIATREGINDSYVSRMVNLITLRPDIVAAILDETVVPEVTRFELAAGTLLWVEQRGDWRGLMDGHELFDRSYFYVYRVSCYVVRKHWRLRHRVTRHSSRRPDDRTTSEKRTGVRRAGGCPDREAGIQTNITWRGRSTAA
jgi:hypothetical protein